MALIDRRTMSMLTAAALAAPSRAFAEDAYPTRPIHVICGFSPGASSDIVARMYANGAGAILCQRMIV